MQVAEVRVLAELDADRCRQLAASLEAHSAHPIAQAFTAQIDSQAGGLLAVEDVTLVTGQGISGTISGVGYRVGSASFCEWRECCG